mmetsp:Transcript_14010/g.20950  ORF Transcript_14010/g.20950 Transcript_14010/m.20950 type:complete len:98 (-) Transcript_14010:273-566(-)|eukprot:CAMPEP_0185025516 /NCGR_PEP_ID=MMETSP1103-20130426/8442_1 /TAXON_ID=36769 /ORGANISM="Paraphysomonas bandaiensis, Strain Caron Lab Isolate" /LENGTH=97 /DNA_ID=CAMNT_0027558729 /DNA_START=78 /DNA_END=371 /DNA_ORIENTATION=+
MSAIDLEKATVRISGIAPSITVRDVIDMFANCGIVTSAALEYEVAGRSITLTGGATVALAGPTGLENRIRGMTESKRVYSGYSNIKVSIVEIDRINI